MCGGKGVHIAVWRNQPQCTSKPPSDAADAIDPIDWTKLNVPTRSNPNEWPWIELADETLDLSSRTEIERLGSNQYHDPMLK